MKDETSASLYDILNSGRAIKRFVEGLSFEDYLADELLRGGVERKFEIMGEALNRIGRNDPEILSGIRNCRDIISFRNILAHGYDTVDDRIVWGIIKKNLDRLIEDIEKLTK